MIIARRLIMPCLVLALLGGCPSTRPEPQNPLALKAAASETAALLRAVGDGVNVAILVYPTRWSSFRATVAPLVAKMGDKDFDRLLASPDIWTLLGRWLPQKDNAPAWPAHLAGWDSRRPIVLGLWQPVLNDTVVAARYVIPAIMDGGLPGVRHRVLVPATDAKKLIGGLSAVVEAMGLIHENSVDLGGGGRLYSSRRSGLVALIPEGDHVRLELVSKDMGQFKDDAARKQWWAPRLLKRPAATTPITPALVHAATSPGFLVLHARTWNLRDLYSQRRARSTYLGVPEMTPPRRQAYFSLNLADAATGYRLMSPRGAETDDVALSLETQDGLRLTAVASLTEAGARAYHAGLKQGDVPPVPAPGARMIKAWLRLNTRALLEAVRPWTLEGDSQKVNPTNQILGACTWYCAFHALLRKPLGLLRYSVPEGALDQLPRSLALVADLSRSPGGLLARAALAGTYAANFDPARLQEAVVKLQSEGLTGGAQPRLLSRRRGETTLVRLGLGVRSTTALVPASKAPPAHLLGELELDPARVSALISAGGGKAALLNSLSGVRARGWLSGRALVGEALLSLKGKRPLAPRQAAPDFSGITWDSPGLREASTPGALCLERLTARMSRTLYSMRRAEPARTIDALQAAWREVSKTHLACALKQPDTRTTARLLQRTMALHLADRMAHRWMVKREHQVLEEACKKKHAEACTRARAARGRPRVKLATARAHCGWKQWGGRRIVRVPPSGVSCWQERKPGAPTRVILAVDRRASFAAVSAIITKLKKQQGDGAAVVLLAQPNGSLRGVNVSFLKERKPVKGTLRELPGEEVKPGTGVGPGSRSMAGGNVKHDSAYGLYMDQQLVRLTIRGHTLLVMASSQCPGGQKSCVDAKALARQLRAAHAGLTGPVVAYLDASPTTRWSDVAPVLAAAKCATGKGETADTQVQKMVVLGPAPARVRQHSKDRSQPFPFQIAGALSKDEIKRVIVANLNQIKYCYQRQLMKDPSLKGRVTVRFGISARGTVFLARVKSTTLNSPPVERCITRGIRLWRFPKPRGGGIVYVVYPFVFKSTP